MADKYRLELAAILEGIGMPEYERLLLIGGLVIEIEQRLNRKLGLLNMQLTVATQALEYRNKYIDAMARFDQEVIAAKERPDG